MRSVYANFLLFSSQPIFLLFQQDYYYYYFFFDSCAYVVVFENFFHFSTLKKILISALKILLISSWISRTMLGNMHHSFFALFIFAFNKEQATLLWRLPLEDRTVQHIDATSEASVSSSSEATSTTSLGLVTKISLEIPSPILIG